VSLGEIGEVFRGWVQEVTKEAVVPVMFQEVEDLCGAFYHQPGMAMILFTG